MTSENKKPIIGITASYSDNRYCIFNTYASAIVESGGIPIVLPFSRDEETIRQTVDICDGILLSGGGDIDPKFYGEEVLNETVQFGKCRDEFEFGLFAIARKKGVPIMGICRGMQVINVALGGSLYQDLPSQYESDISHAQSTPKTEPSHSVRVVPSTPLYKLSGCDVMTANSFHHQAVKRLGEGLVPMAYAEDGIIEGMFCNVGSYVMAYQWHPERLSAIDEKNRLLFDDLIAAARGMKNEK